MTEQQQTKAITPYEKLKSIISTEEIQERFRQILGQKSQGFLASVVNTVYTNAALRNCEPNSILIAAVKAAVLDLPVDPNLGFAWIIPYGNQAQFQMGYRGYVQLALRSGQYQSINATEIFEGERVIEDRLTGAIKLNGKKVSDTVVGYVSYFKLLNGFEKYLYMSREQVEAHAKKYSKSFGRKDSAWATSFDQMGKKTVLKALVSKYGIMSIQMMSAMKEEQYDDLSVRLTLDSETGEVIDGMSTDVTEEIPQPPDAGVPEPVEPEPPAGEQQPLDTADQLVADGKIDHRNHALNIIQKRKPSCPLTEYDFVVAYNAWKDFGASSMQAATYANTGETPK